jgi:hypothetical protein
MEPCFARIFFAQKAKRKMENGKKFAGTTGTRKNNRLSH